LSKCRATVGVVAPWISLFTSMNAAANTNTANSLGLTGLVIHLVKAARPSLS
jgi:hypothetical protein